MIIRNTKAEVKIAIPKDYVNCLAHQVYNMISDEEVRQAAFHLVGEQHGPASHIEKQDVSVGFSLMDGNNKCEFSVRLQNELREEFAVWEVVNIIRY